MSQSTAPSMEPVLAESIILSLAKQHHVITPTMAQLKLGLSRETVLSALASLKAKGLLEHPEARTALWRVKVPRT